MGPHVKAHALRQSKVLNALKKLWRWELNKCLKRGVLQSALHLSQIVLESLKPLKLF